MNQEQFREQARDDKIQKFQVNKKIVKNNRELRQLSMREENIENCVGSRGDDISHFHLRIMNK